VYKAHQEYRSLTKKTDRNEVKLYLQNWWNEAGVKGMYGKWIILQSMLKGAGIFESIKEDDFYKI
jgi:hypothetical protein